MAFFGSDFIYDNKSSVQYNIRIANFSSGNKDSDAGSASEPEVTFQRRRNRAFCYGASQNQPLSIEFEIASQDPISGEIRDAIKRWLMGRKRFLPLQILQSDLQNVYYNVQFTNAEDVYIGNLCRGMKLHGMADSPFAFTFPKTRTYTYSSGGVENVDIDLFVDSSDSDYLYPQIEFTLNGVGNSFQITNSSDNGHVFGFTGLQANETVSVDNDLKIILSSTELLRVSKMINNKNWFRLVPGINHLNILSAMNEFNITMSLPKKIGA